MMNRLVTLRQDRRTVGIDEETPPTVTQVQADNPETPAHAVTDTPTGNPGANTPRRRIVRLEFGLLSVAFYLAVAWLIYRRVKARRSAPATPASA